MVNLINNYAQILNKQDVNLPQTSANDFTHILNIVFAMVGALAFLMIVIGGFRYVISSGEPDKVSASKRMIVYSAVGIVVVSLAATIVNFVLGKL